LRITEVRLDFLLPAGEGVEDVFEENRAENGVLINSGVEICAEPVGGGPEFLVERLEELLESSADMKEREFLSTNAPRGKVKPVKKTISDAGGQTLTETLNLAANYRNTLIINMWSLGIIPTDVGLYENGFAGRMRSRAG
jgi:hypothetical protein